ncbi:DUF523 domain-containing protein [Pseudocolwellia sp. HL-MZ19]|uniref:DUF523 domain-containing protein n=1 Tax=unclassified Pseudocolwellia TaxID=2848178 RepID=UPI003CF87DA9
MDRIFISACFMGENVRYDGGHQSLLSHARFAETIEKWKQEKRLLSGCPECLGGLPVPRDPAEIQQENQQIITVNNVDVTDSFQRGALKALDLCLKHNIKYALLKESSPSCGSHTIYDGTFSNTKIDGQGVTAKLLTQHNIKVFSEKNIADLIAQIAS